MRAAKNLTNPHRSDRDSGSERTRRLHVLRDDDATHFPVVPTEMRNFLLHAQSRYANSAAACRILRPQSLPQYRAVFQRAFRLSRASCISAFVAGPACPRDEPT